MLRSRLNGQKSNVVVGQGIGHRTANGAKAGIRVLLAAQDPNTLANSQSGPKIIQNISTRLIGRIQPVAQESFIEILKLAPDIIARNASKTFYPSKSCEVHFGTFPWGKGLMI